MLNINKIIIYLRQKFKLKIKWPNNFEKNLVNFTHFFVIDAYKIGL